MNALVANIVKKVSKINLEKDTAAHDSDFEEEPDNFNPKPSALGRNETTPARSGKMKQKCQGKARRQDRD